MVADDISELLEHAAGARGAILTRRQVLGFQQLSAAELKAMLRDLGRHDDRCIGKASAAIFGGLGQKDLGHAPAWIDAGAVYDELLEFIGTQGVPDFVFCLDPWAAQLRSRAAELAPTAKWILISDLDHRRGKGFGEYWGQLEQWFGSLSFSTIVPRKSWDEALGQRELSQAEGHQNAPSLKKPGAWEWRPIHSTGIPPVLVLVRASDSLAHLRVFLDALARQQGTTAAVQCVILAGSASEEIRHYLRWVSLAHKNLKVSLVGMSSEGEGWKAEVDRLLGRVVSATLVLISDHTIVPPHFMASLQQDAPASLYSIPVGEEATAHIVTGNLDPIANYDQLLKGLSENGRERNECAKIVPSGVWRGGEGDRISRILKFAEIQSPPEKASAMTLLELADLT